MALAGISLAGFILRWSWMMRGSALVQARLTRILPHVIDTFLLLSGITLAVWLRASPMAQPWLGVKLVGLAAYIGLASLAYKKARSRSTRIGLFCVALLVFAWIASIARLKSPLGFLSLLSV